MNRLSEAFAMMSDRAKTRWVAILCIAWIIPGLLGHQPWKPDEGYSFGLVYHYFLGGDWLVPTLAGEPFMEKPPLYYLLAALFAKLLSPIFPVHDAARLTTGLLMGGTLILLGLSGRELWGRNQGRISVLLMIGCLGLLIRAHEMITDIALLCGFAMSVYGLTLSLKRPLVAGIWLGTGVGIGFMSKGLIAPGIIGLSALALFLAGREWRSPGYLRCLLTAFVAALPWLLIWPGALYLHAPEQFTEWFWVNNWGRFFGTVRLGPKADPGFYFINLPWYAWPALPVAAWTVWRERLAPAEIRLLLTVFLVMLGVLSLASDARELYAMPMLIPLALLATPGIETLRRGAANALNWFGIMTFGFFSGLLWFFWFALMTGYPERNYEHLTEMQPGYTPEFVPLAFGVALLYTLAWLTTLILTRKLPRGRRAIVNWSAGITLLWGIAATICLPWLDAGKSYQSMLTGLQRSLPASYRCMASENLGEPQRAMLHYYVNVITRRAAHPGQGECDLLLIQGGTDNPREAPEGWVKLWEGARPGDRSERYWLFQRMPG